MYKLLSFFSFFIFIIKISLSQNNLWRIELALNDRLNLPFFLEKADNFHDANFYVVNGEEKIPLIKKNATNDSVHLAFREMDSYLVFKMDASKNLRGYWKNNIKNQRIPLSGVHNDSIRFPATNTSIPAKLSSKYQVSFSTKDDPWPAVGIFEQNGHNLSGTFLTETGDFRFLSGNVYGNELYLSCFDGSHAFLFTAKIDGEALLGRFYSGTSYRTDWEGKTDENANIKSPNELTYIIDSAYNLNEVKVLKISGIKSSIKLKNKPITIIQIMGSWCPNCLDETNYFKTLYDKYGSRGLDIQSIGFEYGSSRRIQRKKLKQFVKKAQIPYPVYLGGKASKKLASKLFPMLNEISSFPTTLFVNSEGEIIHIHTGFNGPGTGIYFEDYKNETERLVEKLLK